MNEESSSNMQRRESWTWIDAVRTERGGLDASIEAEQTWISLEELEERLEAELLHAQGLGPLFCVWYTCPDVCPPGG